jgi:hypothetical protein
MARQKREERMRWRIATVTTATALLVCTGPSNAQYFKTAKDMAKQCITDDLSLKGVCSGYIIGSIDTLEGGRHARGERSCLTGHPSAAEVVKIFVRAILANYAYSDLPASDVIENIYKNTCAQPN